MSRSLVYIFARMSSSRLPNKAAYDLGGKPAFVQIFERVQQFMPDVDYCFLVTTHEIVDDPLALLAKRYGYDVFRHAVSPTLRILELFRYLDIQPNDICVPLGGDMPFVTCDCLPFSKKVVQETGFSTEIIEEDGTFAGAVKVAAAYSARFLQEDYVQGWQNVWKEGSAQFINRPLPRAYIRLPEKYQRPWPWNPLFLDYPLQALQIKAIYDLLYKGKPIDAFGLYDLFEERPMLAHLVSPDILRTTNITYPHGAHGYDIQEILNITNSIVVDWDGREGLCNLGLDEEAKALKILRRDEKCGKS